METMSVGLSGDYLKTEILERLQSIHRSFLQGALSACNNKFNILLFELTAVVREDVAECNNPALTDWRLDQLNCWIQCEVESLNVRSQSQWMNVPDIVADWRTFPVHLTADRRRFKGLSEPIIGF